MIKSPIFYMGNKFEMLPQLKQVFPKNINTFYDMFGGSGVVSMNVKANKVVYNELNHNIYNLFKMFGEKKEQEIIEHINKRIKEFELIKGVNKRKEYDEEEQTRAERNYKKFRSWYNNSKKEPLDLYVLTFYSFSNLIRFNSNSEFNMPIGNQYFNKDHINKIKNACNVIKRRNIEYKNENVFDLLSKIKFNQNDFVYLDPPYLNTEAIYNEKRAFGGWSIEDDYKLFKELDILSSKGVKWCMSNVKENKGITNHHLIKWAENKNYRVIGMNKNYFSLGKGNAETYEICIINYDTEVEGFKTIQESLF